MANQDKIDAEKYRALKASSRITAMGWAGFDPDTEYGKDGYRHLTLNFWTHGKPLPEMSGDPQDIRGRELFEQYAEQAVLNERIKAGQTGAGADGELNKAT